VVSLSWSPKAPNQEREESAMMEDDVGKADHLAGHELFWQARGYALLVLAQHSMDPNRKLFKAEYEVARDYAKQCQADVAWVHAGRLVATTPTCSLDRVWGRFVEGIIPKVA
jgi:hypothetical protein